MDNDKFQKENPLLYLLFVMTGTLFIISSFVLRSLKLDSIWLDVLLNVGATLVSTAGISYLYQRFGTNSLSHYLEELLRNFSITQRAMQLGIRDMWRERRHIPNNMWNTFTGTGVKEVWLMGMAEFGFSEDPKFKEIVLNGASRGCNFRFLLMDPNSPTVTEVDNKEGGNKQLHGRIKGALRGFGEMQSLAKSMKGKVELRVHSNVPQVSIIRSDDDLLVTPYMFYRPGNSSFTMHVYKTSEGIFDHYIKFFDDVWENAYAPKVEAKKSNTH
jgi:hypothetical protein